MSDTLVFFKVAELEDIISELKRYAHSSLCKNYDECPREHLICKIKLDLDTAIAWKVAKRLGWLPSFIYSYIMRGEYDAAVTSLKGSLSYINTISDIVQYHSNKYHDLLELLNKATKCLRSIQKAIIDEFCGK